MGMQSGYVSVLHLHIYYHLSVCCKAIELVLIVSTYLFMLGILGTISGHVLCVKIYPGLTWKKRSHTQNLKKKDCHL